MGLQSVQSGRRQWWKPEGFKRLEKKLVLSHSSVFQKPQRYVWRWQHHLEWQTTTLQHNESRYQRYCSCGTITIRFFLISQGSLNPKIRFLAQKLWSVARLQTETQTDIHESEYWGHPSSMNSNMSFRSFKLLKNVSNKD